MVTRLLSYLLVLPIATVLAASLPRRNGQNCRYLPGDAGWPRRSQWAHLNSTVGGRLIATVPVASVCHQTGPFAAYDMIACDDLEIAFQDDIPATLCPVPGEIFNPYWQNETCSPFTAPGTPCELGNRPVYSINVTEAADVQAGFEFATKHNIRLVIRNTGIDYLGQSTGRGSLALWTYNLKTRDLITNYESPSYNGPAIKLGAGVIAGELYEVLEGTGYRMVAPECGLTGITGGYVQSGGQSQLVTAYGLAADQVLEWEVVTPRGEYLIATPENNTDLYWALAGGGGGTFGVVLSATSKVFPEGRVAGGQMTVQSKNTSAIWEAIEIWFSQGPSHVNNSNTNIQFILTNDTLLVFSFTMPGKNVSAIDNLLTAFVPELNRLNIPYNLTTAEYSSYGENFIAAYGALPYGNLCPNSPIISSRLIPRSIVLDKTTNKNLVDVFRNVTEDGTWRFGCSFLNVDDGPGSIRPPHPPNSVLPAWREAIAYCNPQTFTPYDFENPQAETILRQKLVEEIFPAFEAVTPGSGVLSELDPTYKGDWKQSFFGANYDRLLEIKHANDPNYNLYGLFAVGSDEFTFDGDGRLCRC